MDAYVDMWEKQDQIIPMIEELEEYVPHIQQKGGQPQFKKNREAKTASPTGLNPPPTGPNPPQPLLYLT